MDELNGLLWWVRHLTAFCAVGLGWWIGGVDTLAFVLRRPELSISALIRDWYADRPVICLLALILVWHLFVQHRH